MWFYTYLKHPNDVPSLRTHIQSSNVFLRLWPQYYLPEEERRSLIVRLCHVVYYLGTLLFLTALTSYTVLEIPSSPSATVELLSQLFPFHPLSECDDRLACKVDCVLYAFPDLACADNPKQKLTFGGNLYSDLYLYTYPDKNVQQKADAVAAWERCYNIMRQTTGELQGLTIDRRTVARTHTCFSGCKASAELTFNQKLPDGSPIIFSPPTSWVQMAPEGTAPEDTRPPCDASNPPSLLCVEPSDSCQPVTLPHEICIGGSVVCFDIVRVLIAVALGFVWNIILEFLTVWAMAIDDSDPQELARASAKCALQVVISALITSSFFFLIASLSRIYEADSRVSRRALLWSSFCVVVVVDQIVSVLFNVLVWYTILRRCGRQPPDDSKFHYSLRPSPLLVKVKKGTRKIVNYNGFELFFTILLGWMIVDLTSRMIICQFFYDQPEVIEQVDSVMKVIDFIILGLFVIEIALRIAADGLKNYFSDPVNTIDFFLVFFGFAIQILDCFITINKGIANVLFILRLVRLYRLHRPPSGSLAIGKKEVFANRVERIVAVLNKALEIEELTAREKESIKWLIQTISSGKLYEMGTEEKKKTDSHVQAWMSIISTQSQSANQMADDMENILLERVKQMTKGGDTETDMPSVLQVEYGIDISLDH
ncbi:3 5 -cyclic nucleotide phosphodiesterase domain-containing protein, partial [Cystoisospora suis]